MKYAVIGAEEFIGSRIVEALHLGDGASIVAITPRMSDHARDARFSVELRSADFDSVDGLAEALERCSTVIHSVHGDAAHLKKHAAVLVRAAAAAGVRRIVYVSTVPSPQADSGSKAAQSPTQGSRMSDGDEAQLAVERQFLSESRRAGITGFALRTAFVYGPRSAVVDDIATELRDNRAWLLGAGAAAFNGIYVDNLVAAIRICLKTKAAPAESLYVADAEPVTWRDFYAAIARELDLSASRIRNLDSIGLMQTDPASQGQTDSASLRASLQRSTTKISFAAASKLLGNAPPIAFQEAILRTCAWWRFAQGDFHTIRSRSAL